MDELAACKDTSKQGRVLTRGSPTQAARGRSSRLPGPSGATAGTDEAAVEAAHIGLPGSQLKPRGPQLTPPRPPTPIKRQFFLQS